METSDSEHFESADEDVPSDNEITKTTRREPKKPVEKLTQNIDELNVEDNRKRDKANASGTDENTGKFLSEPAAQAQSPQSDVVDKARLDAKKTEEIDSSETTKPVEDLWDDFDLDWGAETAQDAANATPHLEHGAKAPKTTDNRKRFDADSSEERSESDEGSVSSVRENKPVPPQEPPKKEESSWGGWGAWGVSSIISTATSSVSTLTQNISTVLESGIGVPEPEELARVNHEEEKMEGSEAPIEADSGFGFSNLVMGVSHLTKFVETTGTKVISGGLDTLETIGKKTMQVLQEGDPGLKKKRAFLTIDQDRPVLSQLLREAKEKSESEAPVLNQQRSKRVKTYETLFDDHQGLVHLEALEMLSRQCDIKLQTLQASYSNEALTEMLETMEQVRELCELPDEDEDEQHNSTVELLEKLEECVNEINIPISYKKLIETWTEIETWLNNVKLELVEVEELHEQAIDALAQLTAHSVEQFHKAGELLLVKEHRSTADESDSLVQLTSTLTSLIGIVASKFSDKLNTKGAPNSEVNVLIKNVFFEAANSSSYIQDAFKLLIPVLQVGAV